MTDSPLTKWHKAELQKELQQFTPQEIEGGKAIGIGKRYRANRTWVEVLGRDLPDKAKINYGFTMVCNNCGSLNVGVYHQFRSDDLIGENIYKCTDCGAEA